MSRADVQGCPDGKLQAERMAALQERKQALEALLSSRVGELKQICLQEAVSPPHCCDWLLVFPPAAAVVIAACWPLQEPQTSAFHLRFFFDRDINCCRCGTFGMQTERSRGTKVLFIKSSSNFLKWRRVAQRLGGGRGDGFGRPPAH